MRHKPEPIPSLAQELRKLHPENRDRVISMAAERAFIQYIRKETPMPNLIEKCRAIISAHECGQVTEEEATTLLLREAANHRPGLPCNCGRCSACIQRADKEYEQYKLENPDEDDD